MKINCIEKSKNMDIKELSRRNFIVRLLRNDLTNENKVEVGKMFGIDLTFPSYAVILFRFRSIYSHIMSFDRFFSLVYNSVQLRLNEYKKYVTNIKSDIVFLLCLSNEDPDKITELVLDKLSAIYKVFLKEYDIDLDIVFSDIHTLEEIHKAQAEAEQMISYQIMVRTEMHIAGYRFLSCKNRVFDSNIFNRNREFLAHICNKEFAAAREQLKIMLNEGLAHGVALHVIKTRMDSHVNTLLEIMSYYGIDEDLESLFGQDFITHLRNSESVEGFKKELLGVYDMLFDIKANKQGSPSNPTIRAITKYIDNNYIDQNLNLNAIAYKYGLNPSYLSNSFTKQIGIGVPEYIGKLRIKKAKQLINDNSLKLSDIAILCGYTDSSALNRAFKRYEGVAPSVLRTLTIR